MNDLGFRRRAFRRREGEIDYDLQARKAMEKQERKRLVDGRYIWLNHFGTYNKSINGPIGRKRDER
jgi:hypothetical protein